MIGHALVTGAGGFVGRALCAEMRARGVRVTALQRRAADGPWDVLLQADLAAAAPETAALDGVDTVFHLAGHAHAADGPDSARVHRAVSVTGTARLLAALPPTVARIVYASSVKAMGESTPHECVDETAPARPETAYGRARLEAESLVLAAAERHVAVVRLPLVYGPGVKGNLERMMRGVAGGWMPLLPEVDNRRSLVSSADAGRALLAAATTGVAHGRVYLVSDGEVYSTHRIQQLMFRAANRRPRWTLPHTGLVAAARMGDGLRALGMSRAPFDSAALARLLGDACFDCRRAAEELRFRPRDTLEGLLPAMFAACAGAAGRARPQGAR